MSFIAKKKKMNKIERYREKRKLPMSPISEVAKSTKLFFECLFEKKVDVYGLIWNFKKEKFLVLAENKKETF